MRYMYIYIEEKRTDLTVKRKKELGTLQKGNIWHSWLKTLQPTELNKCIG